MGIYDSLKCKMPLPVPGFQDRLFQTKDLPAQWCDLYEIREDGSLWHQSYSIEDRSDPEAEGLMRLIGLMTRVGKKWERVDFSGEVFFYDYAEGQDGWIEFGAKFVDGKTEDIWLHRHDTGGN